VRQEIVEQFTFRNGDLSVTINEAVIDTGAENTFITQPVADALRLNPLRSTAVGFAAGRGSVAIVYNCLVAWTIYESQGFYSVQEVLCLPNDTEVLIGFDFLTRHELTVDMSNLGLVGTAPRNAIPLTGGGFVLNPPNGFVLERNRIRAEAAKPGEVLRPHPAWRFTVPTIVKR
jgi:predicted aspartyl protease